MNLSSPLGKPLFLTAIHLFVTIQSYCFSRDQQSRLEALFRCLELSEQSSCFFSAILPYQVANSSFPPRPNSGLGMLEKHGINESRSRFFRFSEVAC